MKIDMNSNRSLAKMMLESLHPAQRAEWPRILSSYPTARLDPADTEAREKEKKP